MLGVGARRGLGPLAALLGWAFAWDSQGAGGYNSVRPGKQQEGCTVGGTPVCLPACPSPRCTTTCSQGAASACGCGLLPHPAAAARCMWRCDSCCRPTARAQRRLAGQERAQPLGSAHHSGPGVPRRCLVGARGAGGAAPAHPRRPRKPVVGKCGALGGLRWRTRPVRRSQTEESVQEKGARQAWPCFVTPHRS